MSEFVFGMSTALCCTVHPTANVREQVNRKCIRRKNKFNIFTSGIVIVSKLHCYSRQRSTIGFVSNNRASCYILSVSIVNGQDTDKLS